MTMLRVKNGSSVIEDDYHQVQNVQCTTLYKVYNVRFFIPVALYLFYLQDHFTEVPHFESALYVSTVVK